MLFSIGSYVGETITKNVLDAVWQTDDKNPEGEINATIMLPDGTIVWPIQRVINRFLERAENGIYAYGAVVIREISKGDYWQKIRETKIAVHVKKPWWKFW